MRLLLTFSIFLSLLFLPSCIIGAIQSGFPLNPPLGLELSPLENNSINAKWWGNNQENYFSGYVIFISTNSNDLYINRNSTNHFDKPYLTNSIGSLPTVSATISSITKEYSFTITHLPNGTRITNNVVYYVAVSAYSSSKKSFSPLSNITNITITN
ncbi:MAG: hypothetical protein ACK4F9_03770 [Brevinematia bacterium]